jgi:hypothetical protein
MRRGLVLVLGFIRSLITTRTDYNHWEQLSPGSSFNQLDPYRQLLLRAPIRGEEWSVVKFAIDSQSASTSWCRATLSGP